LKKIKSRTPTAIRKEVASGDRLQQDREDTERRRLSRVAFHPDSGPQIIVQERRCQIVDLSVNAIKFLQPQAGSSLRLGSIIAAEIIFHDGGTSSVEGEILRLWKNEAVLLLKQGLGSTRIFKERNFLLKNRR
jgi:hypothetical protein